MRELSCDRITEAVAQLCVEACRTLPPDVEKALRLAASTEPWPPARRILGDIRENIDVAREDKAPLCQDCGIVSVFVRLGRDVHIMGGLNAAIQEGVRRGYTEGLLRKSMVRDPLRRENSGDNTPALIYTEIVEGEGLEITLLPKGGGSENMSRVKMLKPSDGAEGLREFVLEGVREAGGSPCPPLVLGVGVGGDFGSVALLAKKALLRPLDQPNPDTFWNDMEIKLLSEINELGVGPAGFGGRTTALRVLINPAPTHIAMLPAALCISCHVCRHATVTL